MISRSVHEVDTSLRRATERIARLVAQDPLGSYAEVLVATAFVNRLLEDRLEIVRQQQDGLVEMWWCESWPCTAPPVWPQESGVSA